MRQQGPQCMGADRDLAARTARLRVPASSELPAPIPSESSQAEPSSWASEPPPSRPPPLPKTR